MDIASHGRPFQDGRSAGLAGRPASAILERYMTKASFMAFEAYSVVYWHIIADFTNFRESWQVCFQLLLFELFSGLAFC